MKNLINPFSVQRHLDLWSVAAFDTNGGGGGGGSDDKPAVIPNSFTKDKDVSAAITSNVGPDYKTATTYNSEEGWGYSTISKDHATDNDKSSSTLSIS